jgi:hypothetical protein
MKSERLQTRYCPPPVRTPCASPRASQRRILPALTCANAPACRTVNISLLTWHTGQSVARGCLTTIRSRSKATISILFVFIVFKAGDTLTTKISLAYLPTFSALAGKYSDSFS